MMDLGPLQEGPITVFRECPYCHRPFQSELSSKELIASSEATKVEDFPIERNWLTGQLTEGGWPFGLRHLIFGLSDEEKKRIAMKPEAFLTYRETYRCKHCGKEWTKISVEELSLPREYVEDQED